MSITANGRILVKISMYDSKGALVHMQKTTLTAGNNQVAIPLYRLARGTYNVVTDFMNGESKTMKLIKN